MVGTGGGREDMVTEERSVLSVILDRGLGRSEW